MRRALAALGVTTLALTGSVAGLAPSQAITGTYTVDDERGYVALLVFSTDPS